MAFDFKNVYNKAFAEPGTKINKKLNKVIGKEVFQDIKKMEDPKEYPPLSDYLEYDVPEPPQWTLLTGEQKVFPLEGETITISKNLDICMKYLDLFKSSAQYYMERFMFQYNNCVKDYDTLLNYFQEMYLTGLHPMMERASSLLLPFDVFNVSVEDFFEYQINTYNRAVQSWNTMLEIEEKRNQQAAQLGDQIGGSIRMQGGGFGFRGAMKGVAKAEIFNIGMAGIGKYFANQTRMSDEEKATIYAKFKKDIFFQEVYSDYVNTFLSLIHILSENGVLGDVSTHTGSAYDTMIKNLKNPMFPQEKVASLIAQLIAKYPFSRGSFDVMVEKFGDTEETKAIIEYFIF